MEGTQDGLDIQQAARFVLFLERIADFRGGTILFLDLERRDFDVLVRLDVFQESVFRVKTVVVGLDEVGILLVGDDLGASRQGSIRFHPHLDQFGHMGTGQVGQVHPFPGAVERDHARLLHQEKGI